MKPMLASDWIEKKVKFPLIAQPKIDGVRGLNLTGKLVGRSLNAHANRYTTEFYSHPGLIGMDGELAAAHECDAALCRLTTSALNTISGEPFTLWWLFDYVTDFTRVLTYETRMHHLARQVEHVRANAPEIANRLRVVPSRFITNMDELEEYDSSNLLLGYEGTIIRDPKGMHKQGRSTPTEGGLLRIKRFIEEDAVVVKLVEGQSNQNAATINALGHTERSTHQENMIPNGMVGALECVDCKTGRNITVGAGSMPHEERVKYWQQPALLVGKTIKYKHFPKGVKDKPRFPTFQSLRAESDKA